MLLRLISFTMFLLAGLAGLGAQEADPKAPLMGSSSLEFGGLASENKFSILVIGDAIAAGLGDGLTRKLELEPGFDLTLRVNEQSGIARPEVYDWKTSLPKILEGREFDAVVVLLGTNDRQMIRSDVLRFAFNTPDWIAAYKSQLNGILDTLAAAIPKIYWVSIPPMADPAYEEAMQLVLKLQKERVAARGATFVNIREALLDAAGKFAEQGPGDTGKIQRLRGKDGVTLSRNGNNLVAQIVLNAIKEGGISAPVMVAKPQPSAAPELKADLPIFGQLDSDGLATTFRPADLGAVALASAAGSGAVAAGLAALQSLSPPGSSAEKLFVMGEPPPPPPGRVDDFSLPK